PGECRAGAAPAGGGGRRGGPKGAGAPTPMTATASNVPTRATVLLTPEATPASPGPTADRTLVVSGAIVSAMPRPMSSIGPRKVAQYGPPTPGSARLASPTAVSTGPPTSSGVLPIRSASSPTRRDNRPTSNANGRNAAPVAVLE